MAMFGRNAILFSPDPDPLSGASFSAAKEPTVGHANRTTQFNNYIKELSGLCMENKIPVGIFSNCPDKWCEKVASKLNSEYSMNIDKFYSCENICMYPHLFKPDINVYHNVEDDLNKSFKNHEIIFIDDLFCNLEPVRNRLPWYPVLFKENKTFTKENLLPNVSNMYEIKELVKQKLSYTQEKRFSIYLISNKVKNVRLLKETIRSCVPYTTSNEKIDEIIIEANKEGRALMFSSNKREAVSVGMCMIENGFDINIEEKPL
jgi:hypothetical protein